MSRSITDKKTSNIKLKADIGNFRRCELGKSPIDCLQRLRHTWFRTQSLLLSRGMPSGDRSIPTPFNVMIMYEDLETGKRAKKGFDYVAKAFGNDLEFRHSMWRLDILQDPKLNFLAAPALGEADLLIISLRGERQLPPRIRALIDDRLAQTANHDCALVALFEGASSATRDSVYTAWRILPDTTDSTLFLSRRLAR